MNSNPLIPNLVFEKHEFHSGRNGLGNVDGVTGNDCLGIHSIWLCLHLTYLGLFFFSYWKIVSINNCYILSDKSLVRGHLSPLWPSIAHLINTFLWQLFCHDSLLLPNTSTCKLSSFPLTPDLVTYLIQWIYTMCIQ